MSSPPYPRFWSDDFDMDLPKVLPDLDELLAPAAAMSLWTYGGTSHDRLNHPSCWNTYDGSVAYFGLDDSGAWKPAEYYTGQPLVECTWREAVRDAWPHGFLLVVNGEQIWNGATLQPAFDDLMCDLRGWRTLPAGRADELKKQVADSLRAATERLVHLRASLLTVGQLAFLPNRLKPGHAGYELGVEIYSQPGRIASVEDGWAMVDRGSWGQFGCPVSDLRPAAGYDVDLCCRCPAGFCIDDCGCQCKPDPEVAWGGRT